MVKKESVDRIRPFLREMGKKAHFLGPEPERELEFHGDLVGAQLIAGPVFGEIFLEGEPAFVLGS